MKAYLDLVRDIIDNGTLHKNRTGVDTIRVWGRSISCDLQDGFPLLTTKKMATKTAFVEILGFIRGEVNVNWYKERGCKIWDSNHGDWHGPQLEADKKALECLKTADAGIRKSKEFEEDRKRLTESIDHREENPDSLGFIYGYQWRNLNGYDQLKEIYKAIKLGSNSRRLIMSAWNPSQFHMMCLPPCHVMYHFAVRGDYLDISMTQRSCDVGLGVPFNIANTALICHIMAHCADLKPGKLCWSGNDVHIYANHIDQLSEQLAREPRKLPCLKINKNDCDPWDIEYEDIEVIGYDPHPKLAKMEMAV